MRRLLIAWAFVGLLAGVSLGFAWPLPQDDDGGGQACNQNGEEVRCPDGHYHDYHDGHIQPDSCDNFATGKAAVHDCDCERTTQCARPGKEIYMSAKCKTNCRPKACDCVKDCS